MTVLNFPDVIIIAFVENYEQSVRLRRYAQEAVAAGATLICADSGGATALAWGLQPDLLLGDMDSISANALNQLQAIPNLPVQQYPVAKNETDLELALAAALERGAHSITVLGALGGRLDQTLGNLYLLAWPPLLQAGISVHILGEREEIQLLQGGQTIQIEGTVGDTVSLIPLTSDVEGITTANLEYPLVNEPLSFGTTRGISNVLAANSATISLQRGLLFVIHTFQTNS